MATFNFELSTLPPEAEALRDEVRTFLERELAQYRGAGDVNDAANFACAAPSSRQR